MQIGERLEETKRVRERFGPGVWDVVSANKIYLESIKYCICKSEKKKEERREEEEVRE